MPFRSGSRATLSVPNTSVALDKTIASSSLVQDDLQALAEHREKIQMASSSVLSKMIWEGRWDQARSWLSSQKRRHEAWQEVKLPGSSVDACYGLPLHLACAMRPSPPPSFVKHLIDVYPEGVRCRQKTTGLLPLHLISDLRYTSRTGIQKHSSSSSSSSSCKDLPRLASLSAESSDSEGKGSHDIAGDEEADTIARGEILQILLERHPAGLYARETSKGMIPLHIAASTGRSENGAVSDTTMLVLEILLEHAPVTLRTLDRAGSSAVDLAWREAKFLCYHCGHFGGDPCWCPHMATAAEKDLNPLLRVNILSKHGYSSEKGKSTSSARFENQRDARLQGQKVIPTLDESSEDAAEDFTAVIRAARSLLKTSKEGKKTLQDILQDTASLNEREQPLSPAAGASRKSNMRSSTSAPSQVSPYREGMVGHVLPPRLSSHQKKVRISVITETIVIPSNRTPVEEEEEEKEEFNKNMPSVPMVVVSPPSDMNLNGNGNGNATLKIKVHMTALKRPKTNGILSSHKPPNPFFEIFIDHGQGPTMMYQSYPMKHCRDPKWDEVAVDLGVPLKEIGNLGIDIRVMHCHKKGGEGSMIGLCVASEEGSQQCGHAHPVLMHGFQVVGWLRVVSLIVE